MQNFAFDVTERPCDVDATGENFSNVKIFKCLILYQKVLANPYL